MKKCILYTEKHEIEIKAKLTGFNFFGAKTNFQHTFETSSNRKKADETKFYVDIVNETVTRAPA